ncbi:glycosyltransferase [Prescottella agglutinans]|uniref:Glycosyltransferase n=1 Tax=Prescottella agglutinans TaxID=1644129 RepID=A0A438BBL5_9NOCA|nr:glycosyltransferase [Prescottella agglutinans]RVW08370.1 glycosyltransferase [Prescottella agglutinans]
MPDILFVTLDGGGNLPLTLRIGRELRCRGHRVRVLAHEALRITVDNAGLEFRAYRNSPAWTPHEIHGMWKLVTRMLAVMTNPGIGQDLLDAVREDPADLVVIDCMLFNALDAAARKGLRHAVLFPTFFGCLDEMLPRSPFGIGARIKGLEPHRLWRQADLALVCSDRMLDPAGRRAHDGNLVWTGAVHDAKEPAVTRIPPIVLASLSTGGLPGQRRVLQNILDAVAGLDVELVMTTGPSVDPVGLHAPANATVHQYVPHNELMPACSAVIGHGGHGTTFRALAHGLPMLILPMSPLTDQPTIGKTVAAAGAGRVLRKRAHPRRIRSALDELLRAESYRAGAAALGARIRATDGAAAAADQLLTLIDREF